MEMPLLLTKFYSPAPRMNHVPRPELLQRLDEGLHEGRRLSLVAAPAGFGKTSLVSAWIHQVKRTRPVAWYSLDAEDNDPLRFSAYVVEAIRTALREYHGSGDLSSLDIDAFGEMFLNETRTPRHAPDDELALVRQQVAVLLNALAALPVPLLMVLDDYHAIEEPLVHEGVRFLLAYLPSHVHLVLTSRTVPDLALARLRVRGQMTEITADDLRFDAGESTAFLIDTMGLALSENHISRLATRTEGWVAGLQMAALSLQGASDAESESFIQHFAGDDRHILDYLGEEVLRQQPEAIRDFLLRTSILARMRAPLCAAVLDISQQDAQRVLDAVDTANLFIVPLDSRREWYRYHHLFRELLQHLLELSVSPGDITALHQRAAAWYRDNAYPAEAIAHFINAADFEHAARLIEANMEAMVHHNEFRTLQTWLEQLPEALVIERPFLCVSLAWALMGQARFIDAAIWVQRAEDGLGPALQMDADALDPQSRELVGHIAASRSTLASNMGGTQNVIDMAEKALAYISAEPLLRSIVAMNLGEAYWRLGDLPHARQAFIESITMGRQRGNITVTLASYNGLAGFYICEGDLHHAADIYHQGIDLGTAHGHRGQAVPATGLLHAHLASCLYEWNRLDEALHHAQLGLEGCQRWGHISNINDSAGILAQIQFARGEIHAAYVTIDQARSDFEQAAASYPLRYEDLKWSWYYTEATHISLLLRENKLDLAKAALAKLVQRYHLGDDDAISGWLRPRIHLMVGEYEQALAFMQRAHGNVAPTYSFHWHIEVLALQACIFYAMGDRAAALTNLEQALELGEPGDFLRTFVDFAPWITPLLRDALSSSAYTSYIQRILDIAAPAEQAASPSPALPSLDALSTREIEVLRLIAAGLTNQDIADTLFVSVNTVKTHIKRLYSKLHASNRLQAVAKGEELGYL